MIFPLFWHIVISFFLFKSMKKAVPHTTTLMHCKARRVLRNLFGTNQANDSDMTFVAGATKINLRILKT